jgi:hypothetical protein
MANKYNTRVQGERSNNSRKSILRSIVGIPVLLALIEIGPTSSPSGVTDDPLSGGLYASLAPVGLEYESPEVQQRKQLQEGEIGELGMILPSLGIYGVGL